MFLKGGLIYLTLSTYFVNKYTKTPENKRCLLIRCRPTAFLITKKARCESRNPAATTPEAAPRIPTLTPQYNPSTNSDSYQTTSHFLYRCSDSIMRFRQGLNQNKLCSLLPCRVSLLNYFRWFMTPSRCSKTRPRFNSTGEKCKGGPQDCIYSRLLTAGGGWSQDILDVCKRC